MLSSLLSMEQVEWLNSKFERILSKPNGNWMMVRLLKEKPIRVTEIQEGECETL